MTRLPSLLLLGLSLSLAPASAQLLMTVNAAAKTISFSGTDSGTTASNGRALWEGGVGAFTTPGISLASLFDAENSNLIDARNTSLLVFESGGVALRLNFVFDSTAAMVSGNGNTLNYSNIFTTAEQTILEATDGDILLLSSGTGWSSVNVEVVPEPASSLLLGLGTTALLLRRRR